MVSKQWRTEIFCFGLTLLGKLFPAEYLIENTLKYLYFKKFIILRCSFTSIISPKNH